MATRPRLRNKGTVERRTDHAAPRGLTRLFHGIVVWCIDHTAPCGLTCLQVYAPQHHRSRGPSGLTRLNAAARHNTRMGLWGGVRHPRFFWPVWRHILGGPMRVPSHANRGAGFAHTTVGVGGPGQGHLLGCALHPCKPWGVMGCLLPFLASSTRREGRHREAGVLSRRLVV